MYQTGANSEQIFEVGVDIKKLTTHRYQCINSWQTLVLSANSPLVSGLRD